MPKCPKCNKEVYFGERAHRPREEAPLRGRRGWGPLRRTEGAGSWAPPRGRRLSLARRLPRDEGGDPCVRGLWRSLPVRGLAALGGLSDSEPPRLWVLRSLPSLLGRALGGGPAGLEGTQGWAAPLSAK